jgi:hypothetical protein
MLDQVGDLEGLVAQTAILEVDKPAALAVPEEVRDVPIALAQHLAPTPAGDSAGLCRVDPFRADHEGVPNIALQVRGLFGGPRPQRLHRLGGVPYAPRDLVELRSRHGAM